jgi:1,4-alpha-glucan branching enzyme
MKTAEQYDAGVHLLTDEDLYLFNEGTHRGLAAKMGAHVLPGTNPRRYHFAVWAPNAREISVIGDWNGWRAGVDRMSPRHSSGVWEGDVTGVETGDVYKYAILTGGGRLLEKSDPYASSCELPPRTGSVVWNLEHQWSDAEWMEARSSRMTFDAPVSVYEVHLGSWMRDPLDPGRLPSYTEIAPRLIEHVTDAGFSHVEFLPLTEHPFYGSWGYQATGYFAPTSRYGTPDELAQLVDELHRAGIGVLLDWVPSHFPNDEHGLALFDGTHLYEHADPRLGVQPDWNSLVFNYGRHEVRSFLASSAQHWISNFHFDGLRLDAVASMLYRDYSRNKGEWLPNQFGGRENLEAIDFLKSLNSGIYEDHPDVQTVAEESTAWPGVSRPVYLGGLGFGYKWDMGWMHDTLEYVQKDPVHRRWRHSELTFRSIYAFTENFMLPLSHDEVVHGKGSLLAKMPGDDWQRFANLRLLLGYQFTQPGKKLLFMGSEFGQRGEWNHDASLDWPAMEDERHAGVYRWVRDLNRTYREVSAMHVLDCDPTGFAYKLVDAEAGLVCFVRSDGAGGLAVVVCNFTPVVRYELSVEVPARGMWVERLNSDAFEYGGSGVGNLGGVHTRDRPETAPELALTVPPLACVVLIHAGGA